MTAAYSDADLSAFAGSRATLRGFKNKLSGIERDARVLAVVRLAPGIWGFEIGAIAGLTHVQVCRALRRLSDDLFVEPHGPRHANQSRRWYPLDDVDGCPLFDV